MMQYRLAGRGRNAGLLVSGWLLACSLVWAQPQTINVFVPADRALRQHLSRAAKAISEERFSDAVTELGFILANPAQPQDNAATAQDFFLDASPTAATRSSLKTEAQRMLANLPPRGRESYELLFGAAARSLFEEAVEQKHLEKLHEVTRRYPYTKAGNEAALLLGRLYLDANQPLAAALHLRQLAEFPASESYEPELSVLLAACWYRAHYPDKAVETLSDLQRRLPAIRLQIGSSESESLPSEARALTWLEQHFGAAGRAGQFVAEWALFRGNEARNASSRGGVPLQSVRWQVPVSASDEDRRLVEEMHQSFIEQNIPVLPVLQPLAVGNVVLMRTHDMLMAVDFETGKRIWFYPWWDLPKSDGNSGSSPAGSFYPASDRERRKAEMAQRLWQNALWGQLSSDGENVYLLNDLPTVTTIPSNLSRLRFRQGIAFPNGDLQNADNELVALELKREGYLKWKVGSETGLEEPQTAGLFFLGPPLPLFGKLFVLAELRGEVRLVVLDSATGHHEWSQQLAHLESYWQFDSSAHRLAGATPSYADGVLVCPTASGAVVGIDVAGRRLLWGYQYNQTTPTHNAFGMPYPQPTGYPINRWADSTVTIADGRVVLTPPESDQLICLDLLTGQPAWEPLKRSGPLADMLFVACIQDGKIVLVGKSRMVALNLSDGKPAWEEPLLFDYERGEMPSGRGFLTGDIYYLPTTATQLLRVNVREGKLVERIKTNEVLGNLICFKDNVISLGANHAAAAYQLEPLRLQVAGRLSKNPQDPWALARQGELQVHDRQWGKALDSLARANELQPKDEGVRSLLVSTFLTALREDFAGHRDRATQIAPLIASESQLVEYLLLQGAGCEQVGDLQGAAEAYIKLAHHAFSTPPADASQPFPTVNPADEWSVRLDRFLHARLAALYHSSDSPVRERIDQLVKELRDQSQGNPDGSTASRFLALCGFHPSTNDTKIQHVARLLDEGKLLEAEILIGQTKAEPASLEGAQLEWLWAKFCALAKDSRELAASYDRLRQGWPKTVVRDGMTGQQLYDDAVAKGLLNLPARDPWPLSKVVPREQALDRQLAYRRTVSVPVWQQSNELQRGLRLVSDTGASSMYVRDGRGEILARLPQNTSIYGMQTSNRAVADGHLLFANLGGSVMVLPLLRSRARDENAVLWHEPLIPLQSDGNAAHSIQRTTVIPFDTHKMDTIIANASNRPLAVSGPMTRAGVCYQKVRTLTCVDPLTGTPLWTRQDLDSGLELFGDDQYVVAASRQQAEATLLSIVDGRVLGKRTLPPLDRTWTHCGRNILAWEKVDNGWRLFLYDVEQERDVWSELIAEGARGCLVDQDGVAMLQPDGQFFLRHLRTGEELIRIQIPLAADLKSVRVRESDDQWLVLVNDQTALPADVVQQSGGGAEALIPVNGQIFAFSRSSGEPLWQAPATVRGYSLVVEQPDDVPTLWMVRQRGQASRTSPQNSRVDVLCLDRRTGAELIHRTDLTGVATNQLQVHVDAAKREISLSLAQLLLTIQFTDEPRPPEAPAQVAYQSDASLRDVLLEKVSEFASSVADSFKSTPPPAPKPASR